MNGIERQSLWEATSIWVESSRGDQFPYERGPDNSKDRSIIKLEELAGEGKRLRKYSCPFYPLRRQGKAGQEGGLRRHQKGYLYIFIDKPGMVASA